MLKHILAALPPASTFMTAPTALAACALGGTTLHAFAGLGRAEGDVAALVRAACRPSSLKRWRACSVLIVDEVHPTHCTHTCSVAQQSQPWQPALWETQCCMLSLG